MLLALYLYCVWISEQTVTFALHKINRMVLYNRGEECLVSDTHWVLT